MTSALYVLFSALNSIYIAIVFIGSVCVYVCVWVGGCVV